MFIWFIIAVILMMVFPISMFLIHKDKDILQCMFWLGVFLFLLGKFGSFCYEKQYIKSKSTEIEKSIKIIRDTIYIHDTIELDGWSN
jgi:hypothetical protein